MQDILHQLETFGIIPVVVIERTRDALPLGQALAQGGLPVAEITLRTPAAAEAIRALARGLPEMLVGAGTILDVEQAKRAVEAGASFVVSPGFDAEIADWCLASGVPLLPGAATATEIMAVRKQGLRVVKFFPAEASGGAAALRALSEPFRDVRFVPTGGVNAQNLAGYLGQPFVAACGGSWMARKETIAAGRFDEITRLTREALQLVKEARGAA